MINTFVRCQKFGFLAKSLLLGGVWNNQSWCVGTTLCCSCCAGLFDCTPGSEEPKKLRGARDIFVINLFVFSSDLEFQTPQQIVFRIFFVHLYLMDLH